MPRPSKPPLEVAVEKPVEKPVQPERWFIANKHGVIHEVTMQHYSELLKRPGYRAATDEETPTA